MGKCAGTNVDLNILQRKLAMLKKLLLQNDVVGAQNESAQILANLTAINTAIQAMTNVNQLPDAPTLFTHPLDVYPTHTYPV